MKNKDRELRRRPETLSRCRGLNFLLVSVAFLISWNARAEDASMRGQSLLREAPAAVSTQAASMSASTTGAAAGRLEMVENSSSSGQPKLPSASADLRPRSDASSEPASPESVGASAGGKSCFGGFLTKIKRCMTWTRRSLKSGMARVSLTIARDGQLLSRRIASSSGSPTYDRIALELVECAQPYPPFPTSMNRARVTLIVPLYLRLQ